MNSKEEIVEELEIDEEAQAVVDDESDISDEAADLDSRGLVDVGPEERARIKSQLEGAIEEAKAKLDDGIEKLMVELELLDRFYAMIASRRPDELKVRAAKSVVFNDDKTITVKIRYPVAQTGDTPWNPKELVLQPIFAGQLAVIDKYGPNETNAMSLELLAAYSRTDVKLIGLLDERDYIIAIAAMEAMRGKPAITIFG